MSRLRNRIQLIGHLGADPMVKTSNGGIKVSTLRLATKDLFKNKAGEWVDETQWHTLVVWGNLNTVVERYCQKGSELLIDGKLTYREYEDSNGDKKTLTEIKVDSIIVMSKSKLDKGTTEILNEEVTEEDLPF
jgi:single-strand DNA-binding protein